MISDKVIDRTCKYVIAFDMSAISLPVIVAAFPVMKRHSGLQSQGNACNCRRINTYKSLSKQTTLTSSRMNTYKKGQGGGDYC
jgi:hypothetical protein